MQRCVLKLACCIPQTLTFNNSGGAGIGCTDGEEAFLNLMCNTRIVGAKFAQCFLYAFFLSILPMGQDLNKVIIVQ